MGSIRSSAQFLRLNLSALPERNGLATKLTIHLFRQARESCKRLAR